MKQESFVNFKNFFWLWFSLLLVVATGFAYYLDNPIGGRNGGTVLGYTLGVISTVGILYLMWYGIRKRAYYSRFTTLKAVLSSHIWIGIALIFIVAFHCGFSFNYNVHTLAYVLMLATIASGIWGAILFRTLPAELRSQRGGATTAQLAATLFSLSASIKDFITSSQSRSDAFLKMAKKLDLNFHTSLWRCLLYKLPKQLSTEVIAKHIEALPDNEQNDAIVLVEMFNKKRDIIKRIQQETRAQTLIRGWLYLHLPISVALCVALAIHIFSVFYFR